jgi:hypothetical protein
MENVFTDGCGKEEVAQARPAANPNILCEAIKYLMGDLHGLYRVAPDSEPEPPRTPASFTLPKVRFPAG